MSSHFLVDKSLNLESRFGGFDQEGARPFPEPGIEPHYGPDRAFVIEHIALDLSIDPENPGIQGVAELRIAPRPGGLGEVVLDLDDVTVDSVVCVDTAEGLSWRHDSGKLHVHGLPAGGGAVRITWAGTPRRGIYFTGPTPAEPNRQHMAWTQCQDEDGHYFFPCVDHPSVKCPFTIKVRAPEGYQVVSNGRLVSREGGIWVWEQADPMPAYLVTVVVGRFEVVEDAWEDVPLRYLVPQGTGTDVIRRVFHKTPRMLNFYNRRFGVPYAWPRYDQVVVHDFIFGGMENTAATTLTDLVITDERAAIDWDAEDLIAHELCHQWFGDLLTCQDWSQGWLNEGWATYSEHLWKAHDLGQDEADYALFGYLENYLDEDGRRYRRPIVDYRFREPIDLFDRHLYEKGALVNHTLRHMLGDEAFWAGVKLYLERHRHGTVHTRDYQRALEDATGRNLDAFFHQFVYGAGHPVLSVGLSHGDGLLSVAVKQKQTGEAVARAFHFPLRLAIVHGDEVQEVTLPVRERERTWTLPCAEPPDRVEVDAAFTVLSDLTVEAPRDWLIASLGRDRGVVGRIRAARALEKEGSGRAIAALAQALQDEPFWGVRAEIARCLGKLGGAEARRALLAALGDPHPKARRAIVAALGRHRHPDVEAALERLATEGDPSYQVEGEAARSLGKLRSSRALAVSRLLLDRPSWGELLRARALEGLSYTRDAAALPLLLEWTEADRPNRARASAAAGLGRLANEVEAVRLDAVDRLLELAEDAPFRVRMAAIAALGTARDPRAQGTLRRIHEQDGDGRLKRLAWESLQKVVEGRTSDDALASIRRDLERLRDENRKLRDRVARLEK